MTALQMLALLARRRVSKGRAGVTGDPLTAPSDLAMLTLIAEQTQRVGECIEWLGPRTNGYGMMIFPGYRKRPVHRIAYEAMYGPVDRSLHMDHLCRNPACVRLDHLEPVTPVENTMRGYSVPAVNARKTHCKRGHEFTPENTHRAPDGHRTCRTCERLRDARRRARRRRAMA